MGIIWFHTLALPLKAGLLFLGIFPPISMLEPYIEVAILLKFYMNVNKFDIFIISHFLIHGLDIILHLLT